VAGVQDEAAARQEDDRPKRGAGRIDPEGRDARNRRRTRAAAGTRGEVDKELAVELPRGGVATGRDLDMRDAVYFHDVLRQTRGLDRIAS
jgi:hypothetical protein